MKLLDGTHLALACIHNSHSFLMTNEMDFSHCSFLVDMSDDSAHSSISSSLILHLLSGALVRVITLDQMELLALPKIYELRDKYKAVCPNFNDN
jgi:hypothetical protein